MGSGMKSCTCWRFHLSFRRNCSTAAHLLLGAAGEARDEVGHEVLLLARRRAFLEELLHERREIARRFAHPAQHVRVHVLGRDLHVAGDVVLHQFPEVLRRAQRHVHADAGLDEDVFDAGLRAGAAQEVDAALLIDAEVRADRRPEAARTVAALARLHVPVLRAVEIRRGPAEIGDRAAERVRLGQLADLLRARNPRCGWRGTCPGESPARRTCSRPAQPRETMIGVLDRREAGTGSAIGRMRPALERQFVERVEVADPPPGTRAAPSRPRGCRASAPGACRR